MSENLEYFSFSFEKRVPEEDLISCINEGNIHQLEYYLNEGNNSLIYHGENILSLACETKNINVIQTILEETYYHYEYMGQALFEACCEPNNHEVINILLDYEVCPNYINEDTGDISLFAAFHCGNRKSMARLLEYGADPNHVNDSGETILFHACKKGDYQISKLLIDNGGDIYHIDDEGNTLMDAIYSCPKKEGRKFSYKSIWNMLEEKIEKDEQESEYFV